MKLPRATIILANLMSSKGVLNDETKARIDLGVKLHSEFSSDVIVLCGWAYRPDCSIAIADAMKAYIYAQDPELVQRTICQKLSRDTVGDAVYARLYLDELFVGFSSFRVSVITSDYHAKRTQEIFDFVFGASSFVRVEGVLGFNSKASEAAEIQSLEAFRRTFLGITPGDLNSIYSSLMNKHPFYNGIIHPLIEEMSEASWEIKSFLASS